MPVLRVIYSAVNAHSVDQDSQTEQQVTKVITKTHFSKRLLKKRRHLVAIKTSTIIYHGLASYLSRAISFCQGESFICLFVSFFISVYP